MWAKDGGARYIDRESSPLIVPAKVESGGIAVDLAIPLGTRLRGDDSGAIALAVARGSQPGAAEMRAFEKSYAAWNWKL